MDRLSSGSESGMSWEQGRGPLIVPVLRLTVVVCLAMSVMLFLERVYMGIVIVGIKLLKRKGVKKYKWEPMKEDLELGNGAYPMVLVQIPMFNEKEVILLTPFFVFFLPNNYPEQLLELRPV